LAYAYAQGDLDGAKAEKEEKREPYDHKGDIK
jgi:hypothetical protein